jgi:hypothetical protein
MNARTDGILTLSESITVYRPQAECFGGRFDGKSDVSRREVL